MEVKRGGSVALHAKNGDNIYILVMTKSFYSHYNGRVLRSEEEGEMEEKNAAKVLGAKLINLGFETKRVPYSQESIEAINSSILTGIMILIKIT